MKILVLMPVYETHEDIAYALYKALPKEIKEITFSMEMYTTYLRAIKSISPLDAYFQTLLATERVFENLKDNEDIIIFGNLPKKYKFDAIFAFQDNLETLPYEDKPLKKIEEIVKEVNDPVLNKYFIMPFYSAEDSQLNLTNCIASADFLTAYLETDPKLDKIKKEYEKKLKRLDNNNNNKKYNK